MQSLQCCSIDLDIERMATVTLFLCCLLGSVSLVYGQISLGEFYQEDLYPTESAVQLLLTQFGARPFIDIRYYHELL